MNPGYLIFHPTLDMPLPALPALLARLAQTGLTGVPLKDAPNHFLAGEHLLQRLTFLGCSPNLPLVSDDTADDAVCTVQLLGPYPTPRLIGGSNSRPPRCHHCRHPYDNWRDHLSDIEQEVCCPRCGHRCAWHELNWRQMAGAGRLFITISQVFPGEAVPTAGLMETLQQTGEPWDYFYAQPPLRGIEEAVTDGDKEGGVSGQ
ncbi:hypothetical protein [Sedimenticola sp.]|uniref:hypothetical protein n=1 Tax=Sedimenticola sp. TaxID=1940285 RepID=UPI003D0A9DA5